MENNFELKQLRDQLVQTFEYAELISRLKEAQNLLNVEGGYWGEQDIYNSIEELIIKIRKEIKQHLSNAGVRDRAATIVNNAMVLRSYEKNKQNTKIEEDDNF